MSFVSFSCLTIGGCCLYLLLMSWQWFCYEYKPKKYLCSCIEKRDVCTAKLHAGSWNNCFFKWSPKLKKKLANLNFYSVLVLVHYGRVMQAAAEFISFFFDSCVLSCAVLSPCVVEGAGCSVTLHDLLSPYLSLYAFI